MAYKFKKASDILSVLMKDYGLGAKTHEYKILKLWDSTFGDNISSHTQPVRLIRGALTVMVDSPAWMHQLTFYRDELIEKVNDRIGKKIVTDIRFKVGKVETKKTPDSQLSTPNFQMSPQQSEKIEGYLKAVKDTEIREAIKKAITKAFIRGKSKIET